MYNEHRSIFTWNEIHNKPCIMNEMYNNPRNIYYHSRNTHFTSAIKNRKIIINKQHPIRREFFQNQIEIRLHLPFSDLFGTKRMAV